MYLWLVLQVMTMLLLLATQCQADDPHRSGGFLSRLSNFDPRNLVKKVRVGFVRPASW
jgi:hypothetical protein